MQFSSERRLSILEYLCVHRRDTIEHLMLEFGVSRSTIKRDIEILSLSYPLNTAKGVGGGVYVEEWFKFGMVYMTADQTELLRRLKETLPEQDRKIMQSILNTYTRPTDRKGDKQ